MSIRSSICLLILFALFSTTQCVASTRTQQKQLITLSDEDVQQLSVIKSRLETTDLTNWLNGAFWTLIHNSGSQKDINDLLALYSALQEYFAKRDSTKLIAFGGVKGLKQRIIDMTRSSDDTASGVAAIILGVIGDKGSAPAIALLLKDQASTNQTETPTRDRTSRGVAALSLGLLGAMEYIPQIAPLLKSQNDYDVLYALQGLGYLNARQYATEIANFIGSERNGVAEAAIYALIKMGSAAEFKSELASAMLGQGHGEPRKTAAFALARIGARDKSSDIAILLEEEFLKDDAAMALALLNATEHEGKIAKLLKDESSLTRKSAALSLGILGAKQYADKVAKLLDDPKDFVRYYAGVSLILMGADALAVKAIPMIEETHRQGVYLNITDFNSMFEPEFSQIKDRFDKAFAQLQSRNQKAKSL